MGDSSAVGDQTNDSDMIDLTGKVTVVAVIMLFLIVVFVFLLHVYAKWFWTRRREESSNSNPAAPRRRFNFASSYQELAALRQGIDPSVLKSIPVVIFTAKDFKDGLECAVCLCDVSEGEKTRLLPTCNHGFHVECIDMWFQSHSSCPICRNLVSNDPNLSHESTLESILESSPQLQNHENYTSESPPNFPTNVLFWGNDVEVRTLGNYMEEGQQAVSVPSSSFPSSSSSSNSNRLDGMLVIDIHQQINEDEEAKAPLPTRLRSVKRLLSRDNRRVGPCSPRDFDVEQATRS